MLVQFQKYLIILKLGIFWKKKIIKQWKLLCNAGTEEALKFSVLQILFDFKTYKLIYKVRRDS